LDAEADDLHMLGEELLQSHLELEGDVVDDDIHPSEGPLFPHFGRKKKTRKSSSGVYT
jgi:hypothetical protein